MSPDQFYQSLDQLGSGDQVPPVEKWNPELSGDMDLIIKANGEWLHYGSIIKRRGLVRVFSKILKREDNQYFLVTPQEKWQIQVEDAPFLVNRMQSESDGDEQVIELHTTTDNCVKVDSDHPIWVEYDQEQNPKPYVIIRNNLHALINRNVYMELAELAEEIKSTAKTVWKIRSAGSHFLLGEENH